MFSNQILFHSFHQLSREKNKRRIPSMGEEKQEQEEEINIGLTLGLGRGSDEFKRKRDMNRDRYKPHHPVQFHVLFPSHHHYHPKEEIVENEVIDIDRSSSKRVEENDANKNNNKNCNSSSTNDDNKYSSTRKKLRLTKEQSTLLEDSFKQHHTLNQMQKHELAEKLNLQPRQVEVWFQNRRARTKLKQTEVDCEFLKKCCDSLSDENKRLKRELQELRSIKVLGSSSSSPFYVQLPKSGALTMCTACQRINAKAIENKKLTVMNNKPISKFHGGIDNSSSSLAC